MENPYPVGTRIRFVKTLDAEATGDTPAFLYARCEEFGEIVGHGTQEGYFVKADSWPAGFGASVDEFEVILKEVKR